MADAKGAYIGGVPVQFKDAAARAMISDEYNSAETYAKGNLCIYNGKIYEAIKETTGIWDATAWEETTLAKVNSKLNGDIASLTEKMYVSYDSVGIIVNESSDATEKKITISQDGFVQAMCKTGADRGQPFIRLQINKLAVFEGQAENATYRYLWTPLFPVKAGDVVIYTITNETSSGERTIRLYGYR